VNGLSDHDAQFLTVNNYYKSKFNTLETKNQEINNETIAQFQHLLENETWEPVFKNKDKYL
jgi:hypothetical protein